MLGAVRGRTGVRPLAHATEGEAMNTPVNVATPPSAAGTTRACVYAHA